MYHRERQPHAPAGNSKKVSVNRRQSRSLSYYMIWKWIIEKHEQTKEDKGEAYKENVRLGFGWIEREMEGGGHGFLKAMRSTRFNYGQFPRR